MHFRSSCLLILAVSLPNNTMEKPQQNAIARVTKKTETAAEAIKELREECKEQVDLVASGIIAELHNSGNEHLNGREQDESFSYLIDMTTEWNIIDHIKKIHEQLGFIIDSEDKLINFDNLLLPAPESLVELAKQQEIFCQLTQTTNNLLQTTLALSYYQKIRHTQKSAKLLPILDKMLKRKDMP